MLCIFVGINYYTTNTVSKHFAKIQAFGLTINSNILEAIENSEVYKDYFKKCEEELAVAKSTKLETCWVTFFDLLVDHKRKLKNYAGNQEY